MTFLRRLFGFATLAAVAVGAVFVLAAPRSWLARTRRPLLRGRIDGDARGRRSGCRRVAEPCPGCAGGGASRLSNRMRDDELRRAIRERAYLEGSFVLRSGQRSSFYVDKYRFSTEPVTARAARSPARGDGRQRGSLRRAARRPRARARCRWRLRRRSSSRLPFVIVRKEPKEYGTGNRLEGEFSPGERVCLRRGRGDDAAAPRWTPFTPCARRVSSAQTAVCVVDREEGGADALARVAVRLRPHLSRGRDSSSA